MIRARVIASGRVQGVWYRQSCRDVAMSAGVRGWVRNNADGTVEAVLEGDEAAVERVVAWMRTGPPGAVVEDLRVANEPPEGARSFEVR
jgi:acylphosphatase